jgi:hypothetical protein
VQANHQLPTRRFHLKIRHGSLFLSVVLIGAAPAFADKLPVNLPDGTGDSISIQGPFSKTLDKESFVFRSVSLESFADGHFRSTSNFALRVSDLAKDDDTSDLLGRLNFRWDKSRRDARWSELGFRSAHSFGRDNDAGLSEPVATREPGSGTLLFFGFAVLGIFVCRRSTV